MAHDKAYLICENKCLVEGMPKEELVERFEDVEEKKADNVEVTTYKAGLMPSSSFIKLNNVRLFSRFDTNPLNLYDALKRRLNDSSSGFIKWYPVVATFYIGSTLYHSYAMYLNGNDIRFNTDGNTSGGNYNLTLNSSGFDKGYCNFCSVIAAFSTDV